MPAHTSTKSSLGGWLNAATSATEQAVGTELKYSMLKIKCDKPAAAQRGASRVEML